MKTSLFRREREREREREERERFSLYMPFRIVKIALHGGEV
jgi:hypothetical protein